MKKIIVFFLFIGLFMQVTYGSTNKKISFERPIFTCLLEKENIRTYWIPAFLVRSIISHSENDNEICDLLDGCKSIRLAFEERNQTLNLQTSKKILKELELSGYKNIAQIIDNKSAISILALIDRDYIKELIVFINDDGSLIALSLKGKFNPKEIAKSIKNMQKSKHKSEQY